MKCFRAEPLCIHYNDASGDCNNDCLIRALASLEAEIAALQKQLKKQSIELEYAQKFSALQDKPDYWKMLKDIELDERIIELKRKLISLLALVSHLIEMRVKSMW